MEWLTDEPFCGVSCVDFFHDHRRRLWILHPVLAVVLVYPHGVVVRLACRHGSDGWPR